MIFRDHSWLCAQGLVLMVASGPFVVLGIDPDHFPCYSLSDPTLFFTPIQTSKCHFILEAPHPTFQCQIIRGSLPAILFLLPIPLCSVF